MWKIGLLCIPTSGHAVTHLHDTVPDQKGRQELRSDVQNQMFLFVRRSSPGKGREWEREGEREREIGVRYLLIGFAHKKLRWQFIAWTSAKYESGSASPWLASFIFSPTVSLDPSLFSHSLTCSVTRWLDYFSAFGHLYEQTFAQWHRKFAKVAPKFCQVVNKPLKICPSQTVEIFPNLITLHLW